MPEENFEQQARRKVEEFGMEPSSNVWLRVKEAITPAKRRRKVLLWWWLLPLCIAGMVTIWLNHDREVLAERELSVTKTNGNHLEQKEKFSSLQQNKTERAQQTLLAAKKKAGRKDLYAGKPVYQILNGIISARKSDKEVKTDSLSIVPFENVISEQDKKENEIVTGNRSDITIENKETKTITDSDLDTNLQNKTGTQRTPIITDSIDIKREAKAEVLSIAADNNLAKKSAFKEETAKTGKPKKKRNWQIGAAAEIGLTSWGKDLLYNELKSVPYTSATGSSLDITTRDSIINNTTAVQQTKNGLTAAAGFIIRKELTHHFYITGQLGYKYQQFKVYNLRGSLAPQAFNSMAYFVNKDNYHTHFFTIAMSTGKRLLSGKRNAISAEAGIDNSFLLALNRQNAQQSQAFSTAKSLHANDFYHWQPYAVVSLPFDWHSADKIRFVVSPLARFGLHSFQKSGDDYKNNHLISAGIQIVYFFR